MLEPWPIIRTYYDELGRLITVYAAAWALGSTRHESELVMIGEREEDETPPSPE